MGRDIWVALERSDNKGDWYNTDLSIKKEGALERVPFYTGRNSVLYDILHDLSSEVSFKNLSEGTQDFLLTEAQIQNGNADNRDNWMFEVIPVETLREHYDNLVKQIDISFGISNPEYIEYNGITDLSQFLRDLIEYIRVTLRDECFSLIDTVEFRVVFFIW